MRCADVMTLGLRTLPVSATVQQAATVMRDNSLGFLPVCDHEGRLRGVLTDRDIAVRVTPEDRRPSDVLVDEIMTARPLVCGPNERIEAAEQRMIQGSVSRMVVVDEEGFPLGIISLTDVLLKDRAGRALDTARQVLAREASGPHLPIDRIHLTPSSSTPAAAASEDYEHVRSSDSVIFGGAVTRAIKEFPR